ncbi:zf-HC2 domain-containing protein [Pseudodesulfovibrio sp. zrk46]|uniref:anti-sigma factor family protein n=1 Tax=Pseudodesulfovibrio sp. zrk46 TaxID=2725288 RepID=UPI001448E7D7|nr:zf-HC2 domain-containing protein [Pseudodesulfovibrio sp. zrk46]QJB55645.1 hypothetical protein HFN16_04190 [Pseudodesulfovibrio sp. zrk46]
MNCDLTLLTLYWSNELSADETRQVEAHLKECKACRLELAELKAMDDLLVHDEPAQAPKDFVAAAIHKAAPASYSARLLEFLRRPAVSYPAYGAIAMAAAIMLVVMGPWFDSSKVTEISNLTIGQSSSFLQHRVNKAQRQSHKDAPFKRTTNFRARAGHLAKKIQLAKRLTHSRNRTFKTTR